MKIITSTNIGFSTERVSDRHLLVNSCGINGAESEDALIVRSEGRADFHILYVYSGRCSLYLKGEKILMTSGDMAVFYPYDEQKYYFEKTGENKVYWVHFTGRCATEILSDCGFSCGGVYRLGYSDALVSSLESMIAHARMRQSEAQAMCSSLLHFSVAEMGRLSRAEGHESDKRDKILYIAARMEENIKNQKKIDEYARECHLSRDRFVHLFKDVTGVSPYRYMMNIRMEKAQRLLRFSLLSIAEIGETLGFDDALYFSRIFKKHTGVSPSEYRKSANEK